MRSRWTGPEALAASSLASLFPVQELSLFANLIHRAASAPIVETIGMRDAV